MSFNAMTTQEKPDRVIANDGFFPELSGAASPGWFLNKNEWRFVRIRSPHKPGKLLLILFLASSIQKLRLLGASQRPVHQSVDFPVFVSRHPDVLARFRRTAGKVSNQDAN